MKYRIALIIITIFMLGGCSSGTIDANGNLNEGTNQKIQDSVKADEVVQKLIYFGNIPYDVTFNSMDEVNNLDLDKTVDDNNYVYNLDNGMILTMDKETKIVYCIENQGQKACNLIYIAYLDGAIIMDSDDFSCVPVEESASFDGSSMDCRPEIVDKYFGMKEKLLLK